MKLVVISPEHDDPRELAVLESLVANGLERYHVRKPHASRDALDTWLRATPASSRPRLVLHQHHDLAAVHGLGGRHWRDDAWSPSVPPACAGITSRSCHGLETLQAALGHYDTVFFGPVFPSLSKPGLAPRAEASLLAVAARLARRTDAERRTTVLALGGITPENAPHVRALGFDGVAVLGSVWHAAEPVQAFAAFQSVLSRHAA